MRFRAETAALRDAVEKLIRLVPRSVTIPILGTMRVSALEKSIAIHATDLDCSLEVIVPAEVETEGEVALPALQLAAFLDGLPDSGEVALSFGQPGTVLLLSGRRQAKLNTLPASDAPVLHADMTSAVKGSLSAGDIAMMARQTAVMTAPESAQHYYSGGYIHWMGGDEGGLLFFDSCDGCVGTRCTLEGDVRAPGEWSCIIPAGTLALLPHLFPAGSDSVELSETKLRISNDSTVFISKLVDGTYPDLNRVIPLGAPTLSLELDASELARAIRFLTKIATEFIDRRAAPGHFKLTAQDGRVGLVFGAGTGTEAEDHIAATVDLDGRDKNGWPPEVGLNAGRMLSLLGALKADTVRISQIGFSDPVRFDPVGATNRLALMTPSRV